VNQISHPYGRRFILLLASMTAIGPLSTDMYVASLPSIARWFAVSDYAAQLTLSAFMFGFAAGQLVFGPLGDRYGRRPIILIGLSLYLAGTLACLAAPSIEFIISARFIQALGAAASLVLSRAIIRDVYGTAGAAAVMALMGTIMGVVPLVGPTIGGFIEAYLGWQANFVFMLVCIAGVLSVIAFKLSETLDPAHIQPIRIQKILHNYGTLIGDRHFMAHVATAACCFAGLFAYISGSSFVFQITFDIAPELFGFLFGLGVFAYMLGTLLARRLAPSWPIPRVLLLGASIAAGGGLLMAFLAQAGVNDLLAVLLPQLVYSFSVGLVIPQALAGAIIPFPHMSGTASAFAGFCQSGFGAVVGALVGWTFDGTQVPMTLAIGTMGILTFAAAYAANHTTARQSSSEPVVNESPSEPAETTGQAG